MDGDHDCGISEEDILLWECRNVLHALLPLLAPKLDYAGRDLMPDRRARAEDLIRTLTARMHAL